jgi:hypothetical protein
MKRPGDNSNQRAIGIKPIAASHRPRWPALNHPSVAVRQDISHLIPLNPSENIFPTSDLWPQSFCDGGSTLNFLCRNKCQPVPAGAAGVYPSSIVLILVLVPIALTQLVVIQSRLHPVAPSRTSAYAQPETRNSKPETKGRGKHPTSNIEQPTSNKGIGASRRNMGRRSSDRPTGIGWPSARTGRPRGLAVRQDLKTGPSRRRFLARPSTAVNVAQGRVPAIF